MKVRFSPFDFVWNASDLEVALDQFAPVAIVRPIARPKLRVAWLATDPCSQESHVRGIAEWNSGVIGFLVLAAVRLMCGTSPSRCTLATINRPSSDARYPNQVQIFSDEIENLLVPKPERRLLVNRQG